MKLKICIITFCAILIIYSAEGKRTGKSRSSGSGRGSSKKTNSNPQPAPTSFSYPQPSAPKPSLFGWQERPAQKPKPSNSQSHSYPSSGTGLSGNKPKQTPTNQESIQRSSASNNFASSQGQANQPGHSYPASTGLSGSPGNGYPQSTANKYPQQQGSSLSGSAGSGQSGYPQSPGSGMSGSGQSGYPQSPGTGLSGSGHAGYPQSPGSGLSGSSQTGNGYQQPHGTGLSGSGQPSHSYPQQFGAGTGAGYPHQTGSHAQAPPPYSGYGPGGANHQYNGQNNYGSNYHHPQGPPPPYTNVGSSYGGFGGHGPYNPGYGSQMPGYFGNYGGYGKGNSGMSRTGSALTGVGIAGAGIGTVLTGLALWNLARSTGRSHHTVIYDNRGQPVAVAAGNDTTPVADSILSDLVNCSLTISNDDKTEVLAIPCAIATSFTPEADVKESGINENANDNTKCTVTVLTKTGKEFMTTIPCSILLNTAAENNVTEPPIIESEAGISSNSTGDVELKDGVVNNPPLNEPTALKLSGGELDVNNNSTFANVNCTPHSGEIRDPINPCYSVNHNLTVIPLPTTNEPTSESN
ncbi:uncharacterized protein LOC142972429 [Anticarsia gemmatalis]|uniref:uncharacterized protein LOC142972429 n=1 Tax=Anticarsia gemmatalis TaxID=129554 RepID=UPI003F757BCF